MVSYGIIWYRGCMCLMRVGLCVPSFTYLHRGYLSSGALQLPTYYIIIYNYIYIYVHSRYIVCMRNRYVHKDMLYIVCICMYLYVSA